MLCCTTHPDLKEFVVGCLFWLWVFVLSPNPFTHLRGSLIPCLSNPEAKIAWQQFKTQHFPTGSSQDDNLLNLHNYTIFTTSVLLMCHSFLLQKLWKSPTMYFITIILSKSTWKLEIISLLVSGLSELVTLWCEHSAVHMSNWIN